MYGTTFPSHHEGLTPIGVGLSITSTIVGGGMVGLPFAVFLVGYVLGFGLIITVAIMTHYSVYLYFAIRDKVPGHLSSLYQLGFVLQGRKSIFLIASVTLVVSSGLMLIYFIVFGDTCASLIGGLFGGHQIGDNFYSDKWFYVIILTAVLTPVVLKKEIREIEWLAILLAVCVTLFFLLSVGLLVIEPRFQPAGSNEPMRWPQPGWATLSAFGTIFVAFGYQQNAFPIFESLKNKTIPEYQKGSVIGLTFCVTIYIGVAICGLLLFGDTLQSSVLINFGEIRTPNGKPEWMSAIIQAAFIILLMCHIPFIFFAGKEALLIMVDELDRASISDQLEC
jgi:amino acid permease